MTLRANSKDDVIQRVIEILQQYPDDAEFVVAINNSDDMTLQVISLLWANDDQH